MKQTEQYGLNQWELTDPIKMADFNADNAKIAAELSQLRRIVTGLCYHVGQLSAVNMVAQHQGINPQAILYDTFFGPEHYTLSDGLTVANNRVTLTGKGAAGTVQADRVVFYKNPWSTNIRFWLHHKGGSVSVTMNGVQLTPVASFQDVALGAAVPCTCEEFLWTGTAAYDFRITLNLNCGNSASMEVYDFYMAFL